MYTESGMPIITGQPIMRLPTPEPKTLKEWIDMPLRSCCFGCCGIPAGAAILAFLDTVSGALSFVAMSLCFVTSRVLEAGFKLMCAQPDLEPELRSNCDEAAANETWLHWLTADNYLWFAVSGLFGLIFGIIGMRAVGLRRPSLAHTYFVYCAVRTLLGLGVSAVATVGILVATDGANPAYLLVWEAVNALLSLYFLKVVKSFRDTVRDETTGEVFMPGGGYLPVSGVED